MDLHSLGSATFPTQDPHVRAYTYPPYHYHHPPPLEPTSDIDAMYAHPQYSHPYGYLPENECNATSWSAPSSYCAPPTLSPLRTNRVSWNSLGSSSSAWTSPLSSPRRVFDSSQLHTPLSIPPAINWPSAIVESQAFHHLPVGPQEPGIYGSHHHTPRVFRQPQTVTPCEDVPSLSACSSPSQTSCGATQGSVTGSSRQFAELSGLGLNTLTHNSHSHLFQQAHPSSHSVQTRTVEPTPQLPTKKRRARRARSPSRNHSGAFQCPSCQKWFPRKCNLTTHMRTHGSSDANRVPCPRPGCGKRYTRQPDVNRHIKTAHEGTKWPCPTCGKTLTRGDTLARHERQCLTFHGAMRRATDSVISPRLS